MSKSLVIYYSLEGNVEFVAKELAEELGADTFRVETVKDYPKKGLFKYFHGGKDVVFNTLPELKRAIPDVSSYELIVIGTPVWASRPAAPLNTVFASVDFSGKKVAAFCSSASGVEGKTFEVIVEKSRGVQSLCASMSLKNPIKNAEAAKAEIKAFAEKIRQ